MLNLTNLGTYGNQVSTNNTPTLKKMFGRIYSLILDFELKYKFVVVLFGKAT
jgi:hypothetical protein